jgi:hypothetical protein
MRSVVDVLILSLTKDDKLTMGSFRKLGLTRPFCGFAMEEIGKHSRSQWRCISQTRCCVLTALGAVDFTNLDTPLPRLLLPSALCVQGAEQLDMGTATRAFKTHGLPNPMHKCRARACSAQDNLCADQRRTNIGSTGQALPEGL